MHLALRKYVWIRYLPAVLTVLFLFTVTCFASLTTRAAEAQCSHPKDMHYRVAIGDTFSGIAARYNVSLAELETYNKNIPHPGLIFPMQMSCIPSSLQEGVRVPAPVSSNNSFVATARLDAASAGVPVQIFVNQIYQESGFNPNAVSSAGAIGIAQFLPSTAAALNPPVDPRDPYQSRTFEALVRVSLPGHVQQQHCDGTRGLQCGSSNSDERRRTMWGGKFPKLPHCGNYGLYPHDYK